MKTSRPDIIFIVADQQRYDTIAALGFDPMDMPYLDGLARSGVHFTQCHAAGASRVPACSSLFNGDGPHTTDTLENADDWRHTWGENHAQLFDLQVAPLEEANLWSAADPQAVKAELLEQF